MVKFLKTKIWDLNSKDYALEKRYLCDDDFANPIEEEIYCKGNCINQELRIYKHFRRIRI